MNEELEKAYALVLEDLEDRNSHTIGRLLAWDITGKEDELMYRAWLVVKNFIEAYEWENPRAQALPWGTAPTPNLLRLREPFPISQNKCPRVSV